jgi:hypothetical protein
VQCVGIGLEIRRESPLAQCRSSAVGEHVARNDAVQIAQPCRTQQRRGVGAFCAVDQRALQQFVDGVGEITRRQALITVVGQQAI